MNFDKWSRFWKREDKDDSGVQAILAAEQASPPVDTGITVSRGITVLLCGLLVFLLWAGFAPLSQGVPVVGFVKVEGNRKTLQHLRGGIIEEILVRDGQVVKQNQPLLRFNETQIRAQLGVVESQLISALAVEARLVAERAGQKKIDFPEFLLSRAENPLVRETLNVQETLFRTRIATQKGEEAIALQMINGLQDQKAAVASGQWILYRYDPRRIEKGENPLVIDSKAPTMPLEQYLMLENRFKMITKSNPEEAQRLFQIAQKNVEARWKRFEYLAAQTKPIIEAPKPAVA